jgi:hypothetical protein
MNTDSLSQTCIDEQAAMLVRFGALVALDGLVASYLVDLELADEVGTHRDGTRGSGDVRSAGRQRGSWPAADSSRSVEPGHRRS